MHIPAEEFAVVQGLVHFIEDTPGDRIRGQFVLGQTGEEDHAGG